MLQVQFLKLLFARETLPGIVMETGEHHLWFRQQANTCVLGCWTPDGKHGKIFWREARFPRENAVLRYRVNTRFIQIPKTMRSPYLKGSLVDGWLMILSLSLDDFNAVN